MKTLTLYLLIFLFSSSGLSSNKAHEVIVWNRTTDSKHHIHLIKRAFDAKGNIDI